MMITLDTQAKASAPLESLLRASEKSTTVSFSQLLKGIKGDASGKQIVQNGLLVLSLAQAEQNIGTLKGAKTEALGALGELASVLNNNETLEKVSAPLELNATLTKSLSINELKSLIQDAKKYLKNKIIQSGDFKKSEIAALPKTLRGLMQVAQKFNIDISKITLEDVKVAITPQTQTQKIAESKNTPVEVKVALAKPEVKVAVTPQTQTQKIAESKNTPVEVAQPEVKVAVAKPEVKVAVAKPEVKVAVALDSISEKQEVKSTVAVTIKPVQIKNTQKESTVTQVQQLSTQEESENIQVQTLKEVKQDINKATLFKVQNTTQIPPQVTTQQIVSTKLNTTLHTPKQKADETLKILLRGTKASKSQSSSLGVDFSVATARVIAPTLNPESPKSLESLLKGDIPKEEAQTNTKTELAPLLKADSFEVKLNEAKQMIKYISQDVKTAIQDYKSPFTRIKLQLNPQKLGEVDLTIVQRGKNLHINLSSNNVAINTLATNVNELKMQLNNSGINNATLNFNNNSQSSDSNAQQQQQNHQNQRDAQDEYTYLEKQEQNEEVISSLEIVVPHYA